MKNALAVCLLLAGCATTPDDIRYFGNRVLTKSARPALEAAHCIATAAERVKGNGPVNTTVRHSSGSTFEVQAKYEGMLGVYMMFAEVAPAPEGSSITAWFAATQSEPELTEQVLTVCR